MIQARAQISWYSELTPAFSPSDLTGLQLWLDASVASNFVLDVSGNIISWFDKSSNTLVGSQTSILNRPAYLANQLNGLGAVVGNGVSHFLTVDLFPSLASGYTIYGVFRSPAENGGSMLTIGAGTLYNALIYCEVAGPSGLGLSNWGQRLTQTTPAENTDVAMVAKYDGSHTTGNYRIRLTTQASDTVGQMTQNNGMPPAGTAQILRVDQANGAYWTKRIYELIVYNRETTVGEDAQVKSYITSKWGLAWS